MLAEILEPIKTKIGILPRGKVIDVSEFTLEKLGTRAKPLHSKKQTKEPLPQWQQELCFAHGEFNCWRGSCPKSLDDCLVSKIIDCEGDINRLAQYELGHGITCGGVIEYCSNDDSEPLDVLLTKPLSFICVAESLLKQRKKSSVINFFEHQHEETASDKRNS